MKIPCATPSWGAWSLWTMSHPSHYEKEMEASRRWFSHLPTRKEYSQRKKLAKGRGKDRKEKSKEGAHPQSGPSASETHGEEGYGHAWNQTIGIPAYTDDSSCSVLRELPHCMARDILHGWHQSLEPSQPSDARCSGSWLHTVNWIKSGMQKVSETCVVYVWHYDRVLPLQYGLCVCQL